MAHIVGCKAAHELTTCKQGANQHAHILYTKSLKTPPAPQPAPAPKSKSETDMQPEEVAAQIAKSIQWNDVTKTFYANLKSEDRVAFMAKSLQEQTKEAADAKEAADRVIAEAERAKALQTTDASKAVTEHPMFKALQAEVDVLKSGVVLSAIEKRADGEFAGFPGSADGKPGREIVIDTLKSLQGQPEGIRTITENAMKAQIEANRKLSQIFGGRDTTTTVGSAMSQLKAKATEVAKAKSISDAEAFNVVAAMPENATLYAQALTEEQR